MRGPNGAVIIITANTDKPKIFTDSLMTIRKKKFLGLDEKLLSLLCDHVVCLKIFNAGTVQQSVDRVFRFELDKSKRSINNAFSEVGHVWIPSFQSAEGPEMTMEEAEELAIECEAEDVFKADSDDCYIVS